MGGAGHAGSLEEEGELEEAPGAVAPGETYLTQVKGQHDQQESSARPGTQWAPTAAC